MAGIVAYLFLGHSIQCICCGKKQTSWCYLGKYLLSVALIVCNCWCWIFSGPYLLRQSKAWQEVYFQVCKVWDYSKVMSIIFHRGRLALLIKVQFNHNMALDLTCSVKWVLSTLCVHTITNQNRIETTFISPESYCLIFVLCIYFSKLGIMEIY